MSVNNNNNDLTSSHSRSMCSEIKFISSIYSLLNFVYCVFEQEDMRIPAVPSIYICTFVNMCRPMSSFYLGRFSLQDTYSLGVYISNKTTLIVYSFHLDPLITTANLIKLSRITQALHGWWGIGIVS